MRSLPQICALGLLCVVTPAFAANEIYRYKDDAGILTFTNELSSIPEQYRSRVLPLESDTSPPVEVVPPSPPPEAVRVVTAHGEYRMGDHDTRADAVRLAVEAAKRQALEQVATYLESVTEVQSLDLTRDEVRTYTAGVVTVLNQQISTRIEDDSIVIAAEVTAQVDQQEVLQAIAALRENESAKRELLSLQAETDQLRQQLDEANQALAAAESPEQVQTLTGQRQALLNHMQADALVSQAWTNWIYVGPYPAIGIVYVHGLLFQARQLHPTNPHLPIVQQAVTGHAGALPPPPIGEHAPPPHPTLLVPSVGGHHVPPQGSRPLESTRPLPNQMPAVTRPPQSPFLPPTIPPSHPPRIAQPHPSMPHTPFFAPSHVPHSQQHSGGGAGRSFGGGHGGGHGGGRGR